MRESFRNKVTRSPGHPTTRSLFHFSTFPPFHYSSLALLCAALFVASCANPGTSLTGGPKDEAPPKVLESEPANFSTNVQTNTFKITFDEYFELKSAREKLVVSPPMKSRPELKIKGKVLEIKLLDSLQANRTYALNFGDALVDLNESNPLDNFQVVFSTGDILDSLQMAGTVVDAFDQKPGEGVVVMLYKDDIDSLPLKELPLYIAKTDKEGKFTLRNLAEGRYKLFALKDGNNNFKYDHRDELIAFSDSLVTATLRYDTVQAATDSTAAVIRHRFTPMNLNLKIFKERHPNLYLASSLRPRKEQIQLIFTEPIDTFSIRMLDAAAPAPLIHWNWYAEADTLDGWISDAAWAKTDTLRAEITYNGFDSLEQRTLITDTIKLVYKAPVAAPKPARGAKPTPEFEIRASASKSSGQDLGKPFSVFANLPVAEADTSLIRLFAGKDSTARRLSFTLKPAAHKGLHADSGIATRSGAYPPDETDSLQKSDTTWLGKVIEFHTTTPLLPDSSYRLEMLPGALKSLSGHASDSLFITFKVKSEEDYGTIRIKIPSLEGRGVLELLNSKKEVIERRIMDGPGEQVYIRMAPVKYELRMILDRNGNGVWDPGIYLPRSTSSPKKIQPEEILLFPKELALKANWELEETWDWKGGEGE